MRCPIDHSELVAHEAEGHIGFVCAECKGAWLPSKYIRSIEYVRAFSYAAFIDELGKCPSSRSALRCPFDCGLLRKVKHQQMTLFQCTSCQGIWFNRGEIGRLLAKFELLEKGPAELIVEQAASSVMGAVFWMLYL